MSEELNDEVEVINSIFGDATLTTAPDSSSSQEFILQLPQNASSLRIQFPPSYPSEPPKALGTHSSSGGVKGAGARDLRLFQEALSTVFQEGAVCLFDAVGEWERLHEEVVQEEEEATVAEEQRDGEAETQEENAGETQVLSEPPPWSLSDMVVDMKSTFVAHVAPVSSPQQANAYLAHLLSSDKRIRSATHNITAWRIHGADGKSSYQDCDDDGEAAAGGRVLHLMQLMDIWDAMVVVTRWYGGVHLGSRRFAVINAVARDGFVKAGMVKEAKTGKTSK